MAINLSNVNISLNEFQRLSIGEHNAGEVKLAGETKLAKMNNHVGSFFVNKEIIAHEEVIAIKQALVKALSQNGVGQEELDRIRKDLGLATADVADRDLRYRSIMPLSRQKIREILDKNAATINSFNTAHGGDVRIRTSSHIYGPDGMDEARAAKRDAVNAKLVEHDRQVNVDQDIMRLQAILTNTADYAQGEERAKIVALAKAQLEALTAKSSFRPRANESATATLELAHGRTVSISTGMSEAEYTACLENLIVRMTSVKSRPVPLEEEVVSQYRACNTDNERTAFLDALPNGQKAGLKARALAVMCLYGRGVTDYATLAVANGLGDADALELAKALLAMPKNSTVEQIRTNPVLVRLSAQAPVPIDAEQMAYVPATSNAMYNKFVHKSLMGTLIKPLPHHLELATKVRDVVRSRLGDGAMAADARPDKVVDGNFVDGICRKKDVEEGRVRLTAEAMHDEYLDGALRTGAYNLLVAEFKQALLAKGESVGDVTRLANAFKSRYPNVIQNIVSAQSPQDVRAIFESADTRKKIDDLVQLYCRARPVMDGAVSKARSNLAKKLGVTPETVERSQCKLIDKMNNECPKLMSRILCGEVQANTVEEIEREYNNLANDTVALLMTQFEAVDRLELPPRTADAIKETLFGLEQFGNIDLPRLVDETKKNIDLRKLEGLLRTNALTDSILDAMAEASRDIYDAARRIVPGKWGADERNALLTIIRILAVASMPGMDNLLDAFFSRPDVKNTILDENSESAGWQAMLLFRPYSSDPDLCLDGQFHAEQSYSLFTEPREIAAFTKGDGMVISGDAATPIARLVLKGSGVRGTENPGLEIKTRINRAAKSIMQTTVAQAIGDELRRDIHNKRIDHFNFERPGMHFELDLPRKIKVRFGGGEAIPEDDFEGARDRFVKFLTNDANATYAGADDRTKLKAQVLMTHATQLFLGSSQLGIGLAFHPEGKTSRINMNRNPDGGKLDMSIDFSRDQDGNIVIGGDLTYRALLIMMTTSGPEYEEKTALGDPDSYATHHLDVVIADADLEKFVNAEWSGFDYEPIQDVDLDNNMPHHNEAAADMLEGDRKLEYRKFDVSYDFHIDKLYEFDPDPGAQPKEITLPTV